MVHLATEAYLCYNHPRETPQFIQKKGEKYFLDLKAINALGLREAGVSSIERSDSCTACAPHRFWSHRVTGGQRGSQGAVILCQEVIR